MSRKYLRAIVDEHVFDPKPNADWFYATHVPFDELFDSHDVEARVTSCARAGSRVAIVGPSGCGKTSLVTCALAGDGNPELRPIWVRVVDEKPQVVQDVQAFARLVIDSIVTDARLALSEQTRAHALASSSERYEAQAPRSTRHLRWSAAHIDAAREITSIAESISRDTTTARVTKALEELLATIANRWSRPVLVIDDSDKVLRMVGNAEEEKALVSAFLSRILPWLSDLDCGKVVAFHPTYQTNPHWGDAMIEGLTGRRVDVPRLRDATQLARILEARLHPFGVQAELSEVVDDEAVIMLFEHYRTTDGMTIRRALTLAKSAAEEAWDSDADRVRIGHVHSAVADLG